MDAARCGFRRRSSVPKRSGHSVGRALDTEPLTLQVVASRVSSPSEGSTPEHRIGLKSIHNGTEV